MAWPADFNYQIAATPVPTRGAGHAGGSTAPPRDPHGQILPKYSNDNGSDSPPANAE